jgi:hypothetical protein
MESMSVGVVPDPRIRSNDGMDSMMTDDGGSTRLRAGSLKDENPRKSGGFRE